MPSPEKTAATPPELVHWLLKSRVKTRQLLLLIALDEEGNMQRAAQLLNMTQPAASKLIKDLEGALGVTLFERHARGMRATWYGESMVRHARMAITNLNDAQAEIDGLKTGQRGVVHIGAITTPGLSLLPAVASQLRRHNPDLNLSVQIESSDVLVSRLVHGKLDIVIGRLFAGQDKKQLHYEPLADEPICAMVRPGHPLARSRRPLSLEQVLEAGWIIPPEGSVLRHRFEQMFLEQALPIPGNQIETTALLFTTKMLEISNHIAIISQDVARYYADHGLAAILPLRLHCQMDAYGLITRNDRLLSPGARLALELIRSTARANSEAGLGMTREKRA